MDNNNEQSEGEVGKKDGYDLDGNWGSFYDAVINDEDVEDCKEATIIHVPPDHPFVADVSVQHKNIPNQQHIMGNNKTKHIENHTKSPAEEIVISCNVAKLKEELKRCRLSKNELKKVLLDHLIDVVQNKLPMIPVVNHGYILNTNDG